MASFDIVSKINTHEVINAVDQANREIKTRFDFKDTNAHFELLDNIITAIAPNAFQLQQMQQVIEAKLVKRGIDIKYLDHDKPHEALHEATQKTTLKHGIDHDTGKKINKFIKDSQIKVQSSIMGDHVRVTGKKKDDLQNVMSLLRSEQLGVPIQFENFRD